MLKLFVAIVLLLASFNSSSSAVVRDMLWHKVTGMGDKTTVVYIDLKSMNRMVNDDGDFGYAIVAYQRSAPTTIEFSEGKKTEITSVIRHYMISCDKAKIASMADYWFNTKRLPAPKDAPVLVFDYEVKDMEILPISTAHPLYKMLCASFI